MVTKKLLSYENPRVQRYVRLVSVLVDLQEAEDAYMNTRAYSKTWLDNFETDEALARLFRERLEGRILVDLACGEEMAGTESRFSLREENIGFPIPELAKRTRARGYVGVDLAYFDFDAIIKKGRKLEGNEVTESDEDAAGTIYFRVLKLLEKLGVHNILETEGFQDTFDPKAYFSPVECALFNQEMLYFVSAMQPGEVNFTINGVDRTVLPRIDHPYYEGTRNYCRALASEMARVASPGSIVFMNNCVIDQFLEESGFRRVEVPDLGERYKVLERAR